MADAPKAPDAIQFLDQLTASVKERFDANKRILSFDEFLDLVVAHPERYARNSAQYLLDALEYYGTEELETGAGKALRYKLFDAPFDDGAERVVGNERTQRALLRRLKNFVREGRINRLLLLHGPNGSAKSSLVSCLMRALEAYSHTDEGALYRFNWVFPSAKVEGGRIGFGGGPRPGGEGATGGSYAYLDEDQIDSKLPAEHNDNPLFIVPASQRESLLRGALGDGVFVLSDTIVRGDLGHRSRLVFDALLQSYHGDLAQVLRHVQVERFFVSRRYRSASVTVEPQLRVDAGVRQLTVDRSLSALPAVLQSQTLFETFGPLVEGNRGIIEYNDMLKRPMDANKYLLATSEKGTVSLDTGIIHIDCILIASANETYLEAFKAQPDWASYKGRIELIRMGYLVDYRAEQQIYDDLLDSLMINKPIAPHTTFVAAMWAVMTRLKKPVMPDVPKTIRKVVEELTPDQKARLYATAEIPEGLSAEQARDLRHLIPTLMEHGAQGRGYEGRLGASPREMKTLILNAAHADGDTLSPLDILDQLRELIRDTSVYDWLRIEADGAYHRPDVFIDRVRELYFDRVERELRESTGLVDDVEYARLFDKYVTHAKHWLQGEKMTDPITGDSVDADARFMEEIERTLGREEDEKAFRSHVISKIGSFRIDNPEDDVDLQRIFPVYFERMRAQYYASKAKALKKINRHLLMFIDADTDQLDEAAVSQVETTLENLQTKFGYTRETAKRAIGTLFRERFGHIEE